MRKRVFGRQLKRDTNERKALFRGLATSLVLHESIKTTEEKAKAVKSYIEKLVTKAKKNNSVHAEKLLQQHLPSTAIKKLINEIAPRFKTRPGGYTRIIKIGQRLSDNAPMVILEWVEKKGVVKKDEEKTAQKEQSDKNKTKTQAEKITKTAQKEKAEPKNVKSKKSTTRKEKDQK